MSQTINPDSIRAEIENLTEQIENLSITKPQNISQSDIESFTVWPRAFRLNRGTSALEDVNKTISINTQISALQSKKSDLEKQLTAFFTPGMNQTANAPNVVSLGIPVLIVIGGILWLVFRR